MSDIPSPFQLVSSFKPTGDQPSAIAKLTEGFAKEHKEKQTLLGVTGSGKTFTMANVIQNLGLPTLVMAHNKTLAGQLYQEFRDFFPHNAVSYFVSYYDYYQPEAYVPTTDTYIEKEATINDEIDMLRLATTTNLLTRPDCIVVASVSCIYNLGSPVEYGKYTLEIIEGEIIARQSLLLQLDNLQYQRSDIELVRGGYRVRGDMIQVWPAYEETALNIETLENRITKIERIEPMTGNVVQAPRNAADEGVIRAKRFVIYPAKHYMTNPLTQGEALKQIEADLNSRLAEFRAAGKIVEAYRLEQKVRYDIDMIRELGFVNGIENYSRYFDGREPGSAPYSLIEYFHENAKIFNTNNFLTIVDESHMSVPQIRAMYNGDQARKQTLIDYGFRLPSALDNRPLKFPEFMSKMKSMMFVSATPNDWEISLSGNETVEQLIRPTGLLDPKIELRSTKGQIEDLIIEILRRKQLGQRTLVTTLTKKMAEKLTEYLNDQQKVVALIERRHEGDLDFASDASVAARADQPVFQGDELPVDSMDIGPIDSQFLTKSKLSSDLYKAAKAQLHNGLVIPDNTFFPKVAYLHSDVITMDRADILDDLRRGVYDVVVGINLLREGLDLPEVTLVAILDADKEGFLRSRTSMIQTIGRAARHQEGQVIMYADRMTKSMQDAIGETQRRRAVQFTYNESHGITPSTIYKPVRDRMVTKVEDDQPDYRGMGLHKPGHKSDSATKSPKRLVSLTKSETLNLAELDYEAMTPADKKVLIPKIRRRMKQAANDMDFELAAELRDVVKALEEVDAA